MTYVLDPYVYLTLTLTLTPPTRAPRYTRPNLSHLKVTSVLDPYVYSESATFSVGYPSTLITFRTSGLSYEEAIRDNGTVRQSTPNPLTVKIRKTTSEK